MGFFSPSSSSPEMTSSISQLSIRLPFASDAAIKKRGKRSFGHFWSTGVVAWASQSISIDGGGQRAAAAFDCHDSGGAI